MQSDKHRAITILFSEYNVFHFINSIDQKIDQRQY